MTGRFTVVLFLSSSRAEDDFVWDLENAAKHGSSAQVWRIFDWLCLHHPEEFVTEFLSRYQAMEAWIGTLSYPQNTQQQRQRFKMGHSFTLSKSMLKFNEM